MSGRVREVIELLEAEVRDLEPERVDGTRARELVEWFSQIERLAAAGRSLALRQVVATRSWARAGAYRDPGAWLADVSGTSVGRARGAVEAARRLSSLPRTEAALRSGALSESQVGVIADAASEDPGAEGNLLASAARDGLHGLQLQAARVKAAACADEVAREANIRLRRSLRHWTDADGTARLDARGPVLDVARVLAALEPFEREMFDGVRRSGDAFERADAYAFDALVALATAADHPEGAKPSRSAGYVGVIRVDHAALVRGHSEPGEVCELAGAGPIPVHEASRLLDDAFVKTVVVDGTDVVAVSHGGRTIPARLRTAVEEMYPECCIEGCHERRHLEIDHNVPLEAGGRTELANLGRPCLFHHRYKHQHDLRLVGTGTNKHFVTVHDLPPPARPDPDVPDPGVRAPDMAAPDMAAPGVPDG